MATDALEMRMARLEGIHEQIDKRLGGVDIRMVTLERKLDELRDDLSARIDGVRAELGARIDDVKADLGAQIGSVRSETLSVRSEMYSMRSELLSRMDRQFYWLLGLLIMSILLPIGLRLTSH